MTVKERLKYYAKTKEKSVRAFEINAGIGIGYINAIRVSIQPDKIQSIVSHYPDLNAGWLLTGEGEMLKSQQNIGDVKNSTIVGANVSGNGNNFTNYSKEEEDCRREVEYLKAIIVEKDTLITEKERLIQVLLDKK